MPRRHQKAIKHLRNVDPVLATIIDRVGPCRLVPKAEGTHFDAIVRSIIFQQLSGKAASTIHDRVRGLYGGRDPNAHEILATDEVQLRAAGLSRQKLSYLKDFSAKVVAGEVDLDVDHLDDATIIEQLVKVKGVGKWTVQMFLIFRLGRPDVLPDLDLGIQNAVKRAYRRRGKVKPKDILRIGAKWTPHSTIAAWYLWRSLETS